MIAVGTLVKVRVRIRSHHAGDHLDRDRHPDRRWPCCPRPGSCSAPRVGIAVAVIRASHPSRSPSASARTSSLAGAAGAALALIGWRWPPERSAGHARCHWRSPIRRVRDPRRPAGHSGHRARHPDPGLPTSSAATWTSGLAGFAVRFVVAVSPLVVLAADAAAAPRRAAARAQPAPRVLDPDPHARRAAGLAAARRGHRRAQRRRPGRRCCTTAVTQAAELFSADQVEIELRLGQRGPARARHAGGISYDGPADEPSPVDRDASSRSPLEGHDDGERVGVLRLRFRGAGRSCPSGSSTPCVPSPPRSARRSATPPAYAELERIAERARARRHARRADRPGQPAAAARPGRPSSSRSRHADGRDRAAADRPQPLQGGQRHARARRRRPGADRRSPSGCAPRAGPGTWWPGSAGTSSRCCCAACRPRRSPPTGPRRCWPRCTSRVDVDGMRISVEASGGIAAGPGQRRDRRAAAPRRRRDVPGQAGRPADRHVRARRGTPPTSAGSSLGGELPRAVAEHEFIVNFQPIVDLGSGEVIGAEALARWHHPDARH